MQIYRADLHIHSVLSPCGDLEMSPVNIVRSAKQKALDIIAITDHNHTAHAKLVRALGKEEDIWVVYGVEITTSEEVHCLAFFDTDDQIDSFQQFLDEKQPHIDNDTSYFGQQLIVDRNEVIMDEVNYSLYPGLQSGIDEVAEKVRALKGLFVPAHVDRLSNGLYAQLGIFPDSLKPDAIEISRFTSRKQIRELHSEISGYQMIQNSDAHHPNDIGRCNNLLMMKERNFKELKMALHGVEGRRVKE